MRNNFLIKYSGIIAAFCFFLILIILCLLIIRFGFVPLYSQYSKSKKEIHYLEKIISKKEHYLRLINDMSLNQQKLILTKQKIDSLNKISESNDISDFLKILINISEQSDIKFVKMLPQTQKIKNNIKEYPVIIELFAGYNSFGKFVFLLEKMPQLFRIEKLAVTAEEKDLNVKLLITCFITKTKYE
jgi:Tfp pilus assembly protein PilO